MYSSLPETIAADMASLSHGDAKEMISVPMIHSTETTRLRDAILPFGGRRRKIEQTVIVRKMTREYAFICPLLLFPLIVYNVGTT
jgi:hypothetical protein